MIGSGFSFGLGTTLGRVAARGVSALSYIKDNLKLFFDFKNTDLEHVGTGSTLFDGTNDQLAGTLTLSGDRSFAFWIKSSATTSNMRIFHCETDSSEFINFSMNRGEINCYDGTNNPETDDEFNDGVWHHVALTQATNSCKIYVDGVLEKTGTTWVNREASSDSFVMGEATGANDFNGSLKNFAIWNRVLSISEVQNIMYKTYSDLKGTELTHLVSWYAMEESKDGDTSKMIDSKNPTTVGYDLSITNATVADFGESDVYGLDTPRKPRGVDNSKAALADQIGSGSASFAQGVGDYIDCGNSSNFNFSTAAGASNDKAFSISAWIYKTEVGASSAIVSKSNASNTDFLLYTSSSNNLGLALYTNTYTVNINGNGDTVLAINKWYHVASTYDGSGAMSGAKLYVNGVLETITTTTSGTYTGMNHESTTNLAIGNWLDVTNREFVGNIAQVGIWDTVLTQEQIQSISQKTYSELSTNEKTNVDGSEGALLSWWGLDSKLTGQNLSITLDSNNTTTTTKSLENTSITHSTTKSTKITADALTEGKVYKIVFTKTNVNTSGYCNLAHKVMDPVEGGSTIILNITSLSGTLTFYYRAAASGRHLTLQSGGTTEWEGTIDNISVEEYNGNPGELL